MKRGRQQPPGLEITAVDADSIASDLGWKSGDRILAISGQPMGDPIDFRFAVSDEEIEVELLAKDGQWILFEIEKEANDTLGVEFAPIEPARCGNQCTFCFVHQMPRGMRRSLYVKDEDFRLSFLAGHFTTLATIQDFELARIARQRLSPQYVSVHAADEGLRRALLGNPTARPILPTLDLLIGHGIRVHAQIVLLVGQNDGIQLDLTLKELLARAPGIESVGIVPVGLTSHRKKLPNLQCWDRRNCHPLFEQVSDWQERSCKTLGHNIVSLADEFYVLAAREVPDAGNYGDFPQLGNGIGMIRQFLDELVRLEVGGGRLAGDWPRAYFVTGRSAASTVRKLANLCKKQGFGRLEVAPIENQFFGSRVTCAGLLTGRDVIEGVEHLGEGCLILPDILLGETPQTHHLLLDDISIEEISQATKRSVHVVSHRVGEAYEDLKRLWAGPPKGTACSKQAKAGSFAT